MVKNTLKIESFCLWLASAFFYFYLGNRVLLYFAIFLLHDISMLGYLFGKKIGAISYNLFHTLTIPIVIIIYGFLINNHFIIGLGLIYSSHIYMDRTIGYGLKYITGFKDTHLQNI